MLHFLETDIEEQKSMKWEHRHLWIIQEMICVMKSSLKIVWKTKITSLLSIAFLSWTEIHFILGDIFFKDS